MDARRSIFIRGACHGNTADFSDRTALRHHLHTRGILALPHRPGVQATRRVAAACTAKCAPLCQKPRLGSSGAGRPQQELVAWPAEEFRFGVRGEWPLSIFARDGSFCGRSHRRNSSCHACSFTPPVRRQPDEPGVYLNGRRVCGQFEEHDGCVLGAGVRHAALNRYPGPGWGSPGLCKTL
jgi:hypothetical protein